MNEGCYAPIEIEFRKGSLLDPLPPAACGGRIVSVTAACEAVLAALSQARPGHATAASSVIHPYTLAGVGANPWMLLSYEYGGVGARSASDGPAATGAFFLGGRNTVPQVEALEARFPIRFDSQRLVPDSGGAGRTRGGLGVETRISLQDDALLSLRAERVRRAPCGREGGLDGLAGDQYVETPAGERRPVPAKVSNHRIAAGETFVLRTSGGGGLGPPHERSAKAVAADLGDGSISAKAARELYGRSQ
jgi:N-methylhydantoinase B